MLAQAAIAMTLSRKERAKQAKTIITTTIPALLKADARARRGVEAAELIVDPPPVSGSHGPEPEHGHAEGPDKPSICITVRVADTLAAAALLEPRVAVLSMASPLRPGGGVLTGATSQEESLCSRTTLYPSLREEFYRLPEVGGIYTPDVLVFRGLAGEELPKKDRFYVDVITAAMLRFPDVDGTGQGARYAEEKDREVVVSKMRAVVRILMAKGVERVVLGAWGCGAYGNPVGEIARAWKRVLLGGQGRNKQPEGHKGLVVVFAIKDPRLADEFCQHFGEGVKVERSLSHEENVISQTS